MFHLRTESDDLLLKSAGVDRCVSLAIGTVMGEQRLVGGGRQWLCTALASLCIVSCIVSLFTIAVIAVNRFLYVCRHSAYGSAFTGRRTVAAVVSTWAVGVLFDSPNHLGWSSHRFDAKTQKCLWDRTAAYHYTVLFVVAGMLLPFVVTTICYWRIFAYIRLVKRRLLRSQFQARPQLYVSFEEKCCIPNAVH